MADKRSQIPDWHRMCDRLPHRSHPGWACFMFAVYTAIMCTKWCIREEEDTPHRYERWRQEHIASGECTVNFEGTSALMEVKAAEVLWSRSVQRHKMRYTTMVSDGDSKAHTKVLEIQPYGPNEFIDKEDCISHVRKKLGAALCNLVSDCSKRGVTLGGGGARSWPSGCRIHSDRKLQIHHRRAIRRAKIAVEMRLNILASVYHGYSTDDLPQHQFCPPPPPPGPDSWCFFKKSIGEHLYPTGYRKGVHTRVDYNLMHRYLEPIYDRLTSLQLLRKCELKTTQNPNESFHHSVWSRKTFIL